MRKAQSLHPLKTQKGGPQLPWPSCTCPQGASGPQAPGKKAPRLWLLSIAIRVLQGGHSPPQPLRGHHWASKAHPTPPECLDSAPLCPHPENQVCLAAHFLLAVNNSDNRLMTYSRLDTRIILVTASLCHHHHLLHHHHHVTMLLAKVAPVLCQHQLKTLYGLTH